MGSPLLLSLWPQQCKHRWEQGGKRAQRAGEGGWGEVTGPLQGMLFRTTGEVVTFLGENTWLFILAVTSFLIECRTKCG